MVPKTKKRIESIPSLDISAIEEKREDEVVTFEVPDWEGEVKEEFETIKNELVGFLQNEHIQDPSVVLFKDPVYDELKKDEKPKAQPKVPEPSLEEKPKTGDLEANKDTSLFEGKREKTDVGIYQNSLDQRKYALESVP